MRRSMKMAGRAALAVTLTVGLTGCSLTPRFVTAKEMLEKYGGWTELSDLTAEDLIEEDTESVLEQAEDAPILEELFTEEATEGESEPEGRSQYGAEASSTEGSASAAFGGGENSGETGGTDPDEALDITDTKDKSPAVDESTPLPYIDGAHYLIPGWGEARLRELPRPVHGIGLLHAALERRLDQYDGIWAVCVRDLSTGESLTLHDGPMPSASLMKLFILGCLYEDIREGRVDRTAELVQRMNGMISASSNANANAILQTLGQGDHAAGIQRVNDYIREQGYSDCTIAYNPFQEESLVLDAKHSNQTCAADVAELLERIYRRTFANRGACNETDQMLLAQELRYKIPKGLPEGVQAGNKTGETDEVENDAAIVYTSAGDYILVILTTGWADKRLTEERFAPLSAEVYRYFTDRDYGNDFYPYLQDGKRIPEV